MLLRRKLRNKIKTWKDRLENWGLKLQQKIKILQINEKKSLILMQNLGRKRQSCGMLRFSCSRYSPDMKRLWSSSTFIKMRKTNELLRRRVKSMMHIRIRLRRSEVKISNLKINWEVWQNRSEEISSFWKSHCWVAHSTRRRCRLLVRSIVQRQKK